MDSEGSPHRRPPIDQFSVSDVLQLLRELRRRRPLVFGSETHRFELNEPLAESAVSKFEKDFSIKLPNEYRSFVSGIGNGGAGPFHGIFPLGAIDRDFELRRWQVNDGLVGDPSQPFGLAGEWNDTSLLPSVDLADEDQDEYDHQTEQFERAYFSADLLNGAIPICHEGCALRVWLVVTGHAAGQLWEDRRSEYAGLRPLILRSGSVASFGAWYLEWLRDCLAVVENEGAE